MEGDVSGEIKTIVTLCDFRKNYQCDACGKRLRRRRMKNHVYLCTACWQSGVDVWFNPLQVAEN